MSPEKPEPIVELDAGSIFHVLVAHSVEFVVIGGLAVAVHGYPRGTKDVDVVPAEYAANLDRLYVALTSMGARPLELGDFRPEETPVAFGPEAFTHGGNWVFSTEHGRIDVMQWVPGIDGGYGQLSASAISVEMPGAGGVKFAGYEDLVAMKRTAGRGEDLQDLARLREARGELAEE